MATFYQPAYGPSMTFIFNQWREQRGGGEDEAEEKEEEEEEYLLECKAHDSI